MAQHDTKLNKQRFVEMYPKKRCNITRTAKAIGVGRRTVSRWLKEDDDFASEVAEAKEQLIDGVEDWLIKKARGFTKQIPKQVLDKHGTPQNIQQTLYFPPCFQSIKLLLEAMARHRGYGMKLDDSDADQYTDA